MWTSDLPWAILVVLVAASGVVHAQYDSLSQRLRGSSGQLDFSEYELELMGLKTDIEKILAQVNLDLKLLEFLRLTNSVDSSTSNMARAPQTVASDPQARAGESTSVGDGSRSHSTGNGRLGKSATELLEELIVQRRSPLDTLGSDLLKKASDDTDGGSRRMSRLGALLVRKKKASEPASVP